MAIWQFRLVFIPEKVLLGMYGVLPPIIPREVANESNWWSDVQPPSGFEKWIGAILPETQAWSTSMRLWGEKGGDEARLYYADDTKSRIGHLAFRVNVGELSRDFVGRVCNLAKRLECALKTGDNEVLVPEESIVLTAIANSTAKKFLDDPVSTLEGLDHKKFEYFAKGNKIEPPAEG
jgi:hypothetical protein